METDFRPIDLDGYHLGDFSAKALYNGVNDRGEVDRNSGYSGDIAALFVPGEACSAEEATVLLTHVEPAFIVRTDGARNWPGILNAARYRIRGFVRQNAQ